MATPHPQDPVMLMSYLNTNLRDNYPTLPELCRAEGLDMDDIQQTLQKAGFEYNQQLNKFW